MSGVVFASAVYTAPKMLAGALGLAAAAFLFDDDVGRRLSSLAFGASAALALLAHGASVFAIIAFILALAFTRRPSVRNLALVVTVAAALYARPGWCISMRMTLPGIGYSNGTSRAPV
jgi:hypothetical protein